MRKTVSAAVLAASLLVVPLAAAPAMADQPVVKTNASCSNGKGGNGGEWNGAGNTGGVQRSADRGFENCGAGTDTPKQPDFN